MHPSANAEVVVEREGKSDAINYIGIWKGKEQELCTSLFSTPPTPSGVFGKRGTIITRDLI